MALGRMQTKITRGLQRGVSPEALSAAAGFAGGSLAEKTVYTSARGVFGTRTNSTQLTTGQTVARLAYNAGEVVAGGVMMAQRGRNIRAAGLGVAAGGLWHSVRTLGFNI